jgi:hypothetical protein
MMVVVRCYLSSTLILSDKDNHPICSNPVKMCLDEGALVFFAKYYARDKTG